MVEISERDRKYIDKRNSLIPRATYLTGLPSPGKNWDRDFLSNMDLLWKEEKAREENFWITRSEQWEEIIKQYSLMGGKKKGGK